ncbi:DUF6090 family protein [Formosa sp. A9]|uniref:DUF6090 family protein n=1 Tax=Formosa sp. A9 TaxID=3442641 RepID=UPI003EBCC324
MKIFRAKRREQLRDKRFKSYLQYAAGEIFLVVLGILIAVQINGFARSKKENEELREYLVKIKSHTQEDRIVLDSLEGFRSSVGNLCKKARTAILNHKEKEHVFLILGSSTAFFDYYFISNSDGYEALKNSNHYGKINNTRLDSLLTRYHRLVGEIAQNEKSYNEYLNSQENYLSTQHDRTLFLAYALIPQDSLKKLATPMADYYKAIDAYTSLPAFRNVINLASYQFDWIVEAYGYLGDTGEEVIKEIDLWLE